MAFGGPNRLFLGRDNFQKLLNFCFLCFSFNFTFVSDLILGSLWAFGPKMAILRGKVQKQFLGSAQVIEQLFFLCSFNFDFLGP